MEVENLPAKRGYFWQKPGGFRVLGPGHTGHVKTIVMSSIEQIFLLLSKMGCLCTKQSIRIEGVNYANIEKIGEG